MEGTTEGRPDHSVGATGPEIGEEDAEDVGDRESRGAQPLAPESQYVDPSITTAQDGQMYSGCLSEVHGCLGTIAEIGAAIVEFFQYW
ncbi:MAG TPA: hypothetical protein VF221_05690 [Chloroflexota bacterium]